MTVCTHSTVYTSWEVVPARDTMTHAALISTGASMMVFFVTRCEQKLNWQSTLGQRATLVSPSMSESMRQNPGGQNKRPETAAVGGNNLVLCDIQTKNIHTLISVKQSKNNGSGWDRSCQPAPHDFDHPVISLPTST